MKNKKKEESVASAAGTAERIAYDEKMRRLHNYAVEHNIKARVAREYAYEEVLALLEGIGENAKKIYEKEDCTWANAGEMQRLQRNLEEIAEYLEVK